MAMRRVAITGLGVMCSIGQSVAELQASLRDSRAGIGPISLVSREGLQAKVAAEIRDYVATEHFDERRLVLLDRTSQFALLAADQALADSGLDLDKIDRSRVMTVLGTGTGCATSIDENFYATYKMGGRPHPLCVPKLMCNAPVSQITMAHGLTGPSFMVSTACASASHAIGVAFQMIRAGLADVAVTGGCDATLSWGQLRAWDGLRVMASDTCRPFSRDRLGMVLGEGAGVVILEAMDLAQRRGADIKAELLGFAMNSDAGHLVNPSVEGCAQVVSACLRDAGLNPEDVDYVNAHGTGTQVNDITETAALRQAFGDHADRLMVSSTKSMHGHTIGAGGAIELCATIASARGGFIPPTINFSEPDPRCDLDYVPNVARDARMRTALSTSFAFGGPNAALAVGLGWS
jgi:nodulation protein E